MRAMPRVPVLIAVIAALLVALLAPAYAGGLRIGSWTQICTGTGMAWVQVPGDDPSAPHTGNHCPWCAAQPGLALPPTPPLAPWLHATPAHAMPAAFWQAPHTAHAWAPAQARAPPRV